MARSVSAICPNIIRCIFPSSLAFAKSSFNPNNSFSRSSCSTAGGFGFERGSGGGIDGDRDGFAGGGNSG